MFDITSLSVIIVGLHGQIFVASRDKRNTHVPPLPPPTKAHTRTHTHTHRQTHTHTTAWVHENTDCHMLAHMQVHHP